MITDYLKAGYPSNLSEKGGKELKSGEKRDNIEPGGLWMIRNPWCQWSRSNAPFC